MEYYKQVIKQIKNIETNELHLLSKYIHNELNNRKSKSLGVHVRLLNILESIYNDKRTFTYEKGLLYISENYTRSEVKRFRRLGNCVLTLLENELNDRNLKFKYE